MKKRGLILLILLASLGFVSAQMGIGEFLDAFGGENLLLVGSFIISFVLIFFILGRLPAFKSKSKIYPWREERNKVIPGVIAFVISLFIVYGINKFDFDVTTFFLGIGIGEDLFILIATLAVLAGVGYLFWRFKSLIFFVLGLFLFILSLTDWIYEQGLVMIIGIALMALYFIIRFKKRIRVY